MYDHIYSFNFFFQGKAQFNNRGRQLKSTYFQTNTDIMRRQSSHKASSSDECNFHCFHRTILTDQNLQISLRLSLDASEKSISVVTRKIECSK